MPNTKSAAKRHRQSLDRRTRNRTVKRTVKTLCDKVGEALEAGNADEAKQDLRVAAKKLDQAAAKGVIHKNKAARMKSRLSRKLKAAKPA